MAHYLTEVPRRYKLAFLFGCTQPDKNPATYLKGSLTNQWLHGHHWESTRPYIRRISARLENRKHFHLLDFYTMGKLVHYIADAFTFSHNHNFPAGLHAHRRYEAALQPYFLTLLQSSFRPLPITHRRIMDAVEHYHAYYLLGPPDFRKDFHFSVSVCCAAVRSLLENRPIIVADASPVTGMHAVQL